MDKDLEKLGLTEEEFERQFQEATRRGAEEIARLAKAATARYDANSKRLVLELQTGATLLLPVRLIQGLQTGDERALSDFDLMVEGTQIHWHDLDVQFYVEDLLKGIFGTPLWMNSTQQASTSNGRKTKQPTQKVA